MPFKGEPAESPTWIPEPFQTAWNHGTAGMVRMLRRSKTARRIDPGRRLGMAYERLDLFTDDGVRLDAWWVHPSPDAPRSDGLVAVMHHHYGGQKATMPPWIHYFWRLGIPTLSFDARGHADSDPTPSGRGSFWKRRDDVHAAIAEAKRRGARKILGFGQSQGAATLVMALGHACPKELVGVVLDSGPAPDMGSAAWGLAGNMLGKHRKDRLARALLAGRILPGTDPFQYPFVLWSGLLRLTRVPLLWIHGDLDQVIERRWSRGWYRPLRRLSGGRWTELMIPGGDHVRTLQADPGRVEAAMDTFLAALPT